MPKGFILQPTYRIEAGRAVVILYGVLDNGKPFLLRDDRQTPRFWILEADSARAATLGAIVSPEALPRRTMGGDPVVPVEVPTPPEAPPVRDRLTAAGIPCFEADVRFAYRYLIDRGIRGSLHIEGEPRRREDLFTVYENPEVEPADFTPALSVLSFDIETDPTASRILSISLAGCGTSEVLFNTRPGGRAPATATAVKDQRELLEVFLERVRRLDPDVLTGWNVIGFDLSVMQKIAEKERVPLCLGRGPEPLRLRAASSPRASRQASVTGRVVLDGIDLMRGAFIRMESYSLNAVSREILGEEKTIGGSDRAEEILRQYREDPEGFVEYNRKDAELVIGILQKLRLIELSVQRSRLTGMPPDRVSASIASFDFLYLTQLASRRIVAPSVNSAEPLAEGSGGHVLEPVTGLHRNVLIFDFKSLYPSIIRTFQIDPLGRISEPSEQDDAIVAPNGAAFRRDPGILPGLLDNLFPRREQARREGDQVASQAIKILMNSFYGVLGTSACRFAHPQLANAITGFGRAILLWSRDRIQQMGYQVLYGDTDSLFVASGKEKEETARACGSTIVKDLNRDLAAYILETWNVESRLELEFERLYKRLLLPHVRHGAAGARKRYAGLVEEAGKPKVVFTGMEVVRRDWTALARRVQQELYERLFTDRPVDEYVKGIVAGVRAGDYDDLLVYRKALRKPLAEYTASTPPHVAAARKMKKRPGWVVSYLITTGGPEPLGEVVSPIDHEHYVQKQIRPVAEPVLELLELDFDRIIGDDRQMDLF